MKIIYFVAFMLFASAVHAQNVHIPDANFKAALLADTAINTNGDTEIESCEAAAFSGEINVSEKGIADLTGIEAFTVLQLLNCSSNQLTELDVSKNMALAGLDCSSNQLTTLDVSKNIGLLFFSCFENQLTVLDVSKNIALISLACLENKLIALDISKNMDLMALGCGENQLTALDLTNNKNLIRLWCENNPLTCIKVSNLAESEKMKVKSIPETAKFSLECK
jgi:Leucine-rich repeat (LRR) protein